MIGFHYRDGELYADDVPARAIAEAHGTPVYVYSAGALRAHYDALAEAFGELSPLLCYSVKANGNLAVLRTLRERGSGFDVVSGGELFRALRAGASPDTIVFAGVGKTDEEIRAALEAGILCFNAESEPELERLAAVALELGTVARVCLRVNPEVDPRTHAHIATGKKGTKFGLDPDAAREAAALAGRLDGVALVGLHAHIGSQIRDPEPFVHALDRVMAFWDELAASGHALELLNLGGGFGIAYGPGEPLDVKALAEAYAQRLRGRPLRLLFEPGRFIAANAGALLTRVTYVKHARHKRFVIVDTGMHHLIRPALYQAHHHIWPVRAAADLGQPGAPACPGEADIVGPICETADTLAAGRPFPEVARGDLLACFGAGAYGAVMATTYNAHPLPPEVLTDGAGVRLVRRRQTYEDLVALEESPEA
jgi:diaminopimelate decarboxylase